MNHISIKGARPRIAFVKYGGLAAGGTEKLLQEVSVVLKEMGAEVEYFFCEPGNAPGSNWIHPPNDEKRKQFLLSKGVKLREFRVAHKDLALPEHIWVDSNFFDIFNENDYDLIWTAKAGPKEFPFYEINLPFVECVTLDVGFDTSINRMHSILISNWQRFRWINKGGSASSSSVLPLPVPDAIRFEGLRKELGIPEDTFVVGLHQRVDEFISSEIPFAAANLLANNERNLCFLVMGGGRSYREFAKKYGVNTKFLDHSSDWKTISRFLNTLDVYTHGRSDGETFGTAIAEAMAFGLPIVTHYSKSGANAHVETIGNGGFFAYTIEEYARHLERLMQSLNLRIKVGNHSLELASKFYTTNAFQDMLREIVNNLGIFNAKNMAEGIAQSIQHSLPISIPSTRVLAQSLQNQLSSASLNSGSRIFSISKFLLEESSNVPTSITCNGLVSFLIVVEMCRGGKITSVNLMSNESISYEMAKRVFFENNIDTPIQFSPQSDFAEDIDHLQVNYPGLLCSFLCSDLRDLPSRRKTRKTSIQGIPLFLLRPKVETKTALMMQEMYLTGKFKPFVATLTNIIFSNLISILKVVLHRHRAWRNRLRTFRRLRHIIFILRRRIRG